MLGNESWGRIAPFSMSNDVYKMGAMRPTWLSGNRG